MEETANTTELIYAVIATVLTGIIGGFISWKLISNKEVERAKECTMMGEVKWNSRIKWSQKAIPGCFVLFFISYICFVFPPIFSSPSPHKIDPVIAILIYGVLILLCIASIWLMAFLYPVFAITNDSIVLWKYYGYARSEKHLLSELTRKEYEEAARGGNLHIVALYRGEKRIKKLISNQYKDEKELLELLRQIPDKKD